MKPDKPPAPIRALFLDIDGTLIGSNNEISPRVCMAVAAASEQGCEIVLCTGRTRYRTYAVAEHLALPSAYMVTSNGGVLKHLGSGEIIYRYLMNAAIALEVVKLITQANSKPYVYEDSDIPGYEGSRVLYHPNQELNFWDKSDPRYTPYKDLMTHIPFDPISVSAFGRPETMRPLAAHLTDKFAGRVSVIQSGTEFNWGVEVYSPGISKRTGLEAVTKLLSLRQAETMAIGDHHNDIEMLDWAGWGVAMGNSQPELFDSADYITRSVTEDGAAIAIEKFVLGFS